MYTIKHDNEQHRHRINTHPSGSNRFFVFARVRFPPPLAKRESFGERKRVQTDKNFPPKHITQAKKNKKSLSTLSLKKRRREEDARRERSSPSPPGDDDDEKD